MLDDAGTAVPDGADGDLVAEIVRGLSGARKTLPPKLFYDAEGCRLFGLITALPEYYPTRTEMALLEAHAGTLAAPAGPVDGDAVLVEFGASDERKAEFMLATGRFGAYVPIDIAEEALDALQARLAAARPTLVVRPVRADFTQALKLPATGRGRRLGFFPGSTIGNMNPDEAVRFLASARDALAGPDGDALLVIGTDLRKSADRLRAAYDDAAGVTAAFNRNMLAHVNRIAGGDIDPASFDHRAVWNEAESRIEMHLVSRSDHTCRLAGRRIRFGAGETIHTENSYKHTEAGFLALAARAGWHGLEFRTDTDRLFGIHLLAAA